MSVKCASCGFDSPDGSAWCDFCKEPFRKKPEAPGAKSPPAPAAAPKPRLRAAQPAQGPGEELPPKAAASLRDLRPQEDEQLPTVPPWFRAAAWIFLGAWVIWGMILAGILVGRHKVRQELGPGTVAPGPR